MKTSILSIILLAVLNPCSLYPQPLDPVFSDFRGMEDSLGNTHLFFKEFHGYSYAYTNHVHHLDLTIGSDSVLLDEHYYMDFISYWDDGLFVKDYDFWHNAPSRYIYGGSCVVIDPEAYISRWDTLNVFTFLGEVGRIIISRQNDSLIYADLVGSLIKSSDAGITWDFDPNSPPNLYSLIAVFPFNDQVVLASYQYYDSLTLISALGKSTDGGVTFTAVDTALIWLQSVRPAFDADSLHIYGVYNGYHQSYIYRSHDAGNSWHALFSDTQLLALTVDDSASGKVFISRGNEIFMSNDFGTTLIPCRQLNRPVIGLHLKSGSDLIYAATEKDIFEITPTGINSLKSLPVGIISAGIPVTGSFILLQNYPNPFNRSTVIPLSLPMEKTVNIRIYDTHGRLVHHLYNGKLSPGIHKIHWHGSDDSGNPVASGIYFCRVTTKNESQIRKMILLK